MLGFTFYGGFGDYDAWKCDTSHLEPRTVVCSDCGTEHSEEDDECPHCHLLWLDAEAEALAIPGSTCAADCGYCGRCT